MAHREETIVLVPPVVEPIEVEVPLRPVLPEFRHIAVAIDLRDGALCEEPSMSPSLECSPD